MFNMEIGKWLAFLGKIVLRCMALATGALSIARDAMLLSRTAVPSVDPHVTLWAWLRICFVVSCIVVWAEQRNKLRGFERKPQMKVRSLAPRIWLADKYGFAGKEYYFSIHNDSYAEPLEGVRAEVIKLVPDVVGFNCLPLHVRHETYLIRDFTVNAGSERQIDLITGPVARLKTQHVMVIPHTDNEDRFPMPYGKYLMTIRVSAKNAPAIEAVFESWIDDKEELQCVHL